MHVLVVQRRVFFVIFFFVDVLQQKKYFSIPLLRHSQVANYIYLVFRRIKIPLNFLYNQETLRKNYRKRKYLRIVKFYQNQSEMNNL